MVAFFFLALLSLRVTWNNCCRSLLPYVLLFWLSLPALLPPSLLRVLDIFLLFIHLGFLLCSFFSYILLQNCLFPLHPVVGMFLCILHMLLGLNVFLLFWNVLFCLYNLILSRYLFSIPSLANIFWFIFSSCIVRRVCCNSFCCFCSF